MRKQKGYTLIEILITFAVIAMIGIGGTLGYVAFHFISKFW